MNDTKSAPAVSVFFCGRGERKNCSTPGCQGRARFECDYPLSGRKQGQTCGKLLCTSCARRQPQAADVVLSLEYCPAHDKIERDLEAEVRR